MSHDAASSSYDIKSATLPLIALLLRTHDTRMLQADLTRRLASTPGFFDNDPVVIDLGGLAEPQAEVDLPTVCALLRAHGMLPVAVRGAQSHHLESAHQAGLFEAHDLNLPSTARAEPVVQEVEVVREIVREVVREVPGSAQPALVVDKPLRSGQHVYARGRDLIVLAMVNPGAEIMADGHIHVYAPLRGKAIAGARGDESARIFTSCLEAELISIAGTYRTSDTPLPADVARKAAQISLQGGKLVMQAL